MIALYGNNIYFKLLLEQIGVKYSTISSMAQFTEDYTGIILSEKVPKYDLNQVKNVLSQKKFIIDTGRNIKSINGGFTYTRYLKFAFDNSNHITTKEIEPNGVVVKYSKASHFDKTVMLKDNLAFVGIHPKLIYSEKYKRKQFAHSKKPFPHEIVSSTAKGTISAIYLEILKLMYLQCEKPFIHKSFCPDNRPTLLFRIDTDYGTKEQSRRYYNIIHKNNIKSTWFLHVGSHKNFLSDIKTFQKQEWALHCNEHFTTKKANILKRDLGTALRKLSKYNILPKGYSAPYGLWNKSQSKTVSDLGIEYSSEFSYAYDSLPIMPFENLTTIQIPVHPICPGSIAKWGHDTGSIFSYFKDYIDRTVNENIPVTIYDHPADFNEKFLNKLFEYASKKNLKSITFSEYCTFWNNRSKSEFCYKNTNEIINIETEIPLTVWIDTDRFVFVNSSTKLNILKPTNFNTYKTNQPKVSLKELRKFNIRAAKYGILSNLLWRDSK